MPRANSVRSGEFGKAAGGSAGKSFRGACRFCRVLGSRIVNARDLNDLSARAIHLDRGNTIAVALNCHARLAIGAVRRRGRSLHRLSERTKRLRCFGARKHAHVEFLPRTRGRRSGGQGNKCVVAGAVHCDARICDAGIGTLSKMVTRRFTSSDAGTLGIGCVSARPETRKIRVETTPFS